VYIKSLHIIITTLGVYIVNFYVLIINSLIEYAYSTSFVLVTLTLAR